MVEATEDGGLLDRSANDPRSSARASDLELLAAELARLDAAAPAGGTAGPRYAERYLRAVNL